ncbi:MAG: hypothetical protein M3535_07985 [Actinomycetota bacterium]|nr:hypothetical protein [Actinomycetota bacterium]
MTSLRTVSPDGHAWRVRRQWTPRLEGRGLRERLAARRRRRAAKEDRDKGDSFWSELLEPISWLSESVPTLVVGLVLTALSVLLVVLGLPLLLVVVDLVVVVALVVGGVVARVLFRRPWTVEAVSDGGERATRQVVGWRASGRERHELVHEITHGRPPSATA